MSRHIVIISDGDPTPPSFQPSIASSSPADRITVTSVLTAAHGNDPGAAYTVMKNLATRTKGRFYNVTNPRALPRIYQKEARTISRPLIFEQARPRGRPAVNYLQRADHRTPPAKPPADLRAGVDEPRRRTSSSRCR